MCGMDTKGPHILLPPRRADTWANIGKFTGPFVYMWLLVQVRGTWELSVGTDTRSSHSDSLWRLEVLSPTRRYLQDLGSWPQRRIDVEDIWTVGPCQGQEEQSVRELPTVSNQKWRAWMWTKMLGWPLHMSSVQ